MFVNIVDSFVRKKVYLLTLLAYCESNDNRLRIGKIIEWMVCHSDQ